MAKKSIGVDVGSSAVRAAEVRYDGKKATVLRAGEVPLPHGAVVAGEVRDLDAVTDAVRELWKTAGFRDKHVTVGLGGSQTMVRQVDLPWEPADVFREALPLRISRDLPVDPSEMTLDYHPLEELTVNGVRTQRSLIVAAMNMLTENLADAVGSAGLKLKRADYIPFALIRAAHLLVGEGEPVPGPQADNEEWDCEVIVDVGAHITTVAIHRHGRPLFVRVVPAGAEATARALADQLHIPFDSATLITTTLGISTVTEEYPLDTLAALQLLDAAQMNSAKYIANTMAGTLVQVVRESVEYFLSASPNISGVSRVLLSGGGVLLPGYAERIAGELQAPTMLLSALHGFSKGQAETQVDLDPRMTAAIGLALEVK